MGVWGGQNHRLAVAYHPFWSMCIFVLAVISGLFIHAYWTTHPLNLKQATNSTATVIPLDVELTPHCEMDEEAVLTVVNHGNETRFHAKCRITGLQLGSKPLTAYKRRPFDLKWRQTPEKHIVIAQGDSENLLIARVTDIPRADRAFITIWELSEGTAKKFEDGDWNRSLKERELPMFELEITIFGDGVQDPHRQAFTLGPRTGLGPLEMKECATQSTNEDRLPQRMLSLSKELEDLLAQLGTAREYTWRSNMSPGEFTEANKDLIVRERKLEAMFERRFRQRVIDI